MGMWVKIKCNQQLFFPLEKDGLDFIHQRQKSGMPASIAGLPSVRTLPYEIYAAEARQAEIASRLDFLATMP